MARISLELSEGVLKKLMKKYPGLTIDEAIKEAITAEVEGRAKDKEVIEEEIASLHSVVNNLQRIVRYMGDTVNS